jgi:hypothetical protein
MSDAAGGCAARRSPSFLHGDYGEINRLTLALPMW